MRDVAQHLAPGRAPVGIEQHPEHALRQFGVLREQAEELFVEQREADGDAAGLHRRLLRHAFEHLVEAKGGRSRDLFRDAGRAVFVHRHARDLSVEEELQLDGAPARLVDRAPRLVPHLPAGAGDAEELVDGRDLEQRQPRQPIGQLHRRQRLEPALLALLGAETPAGQRPRGRLEHVPVLRVAMLERVLEVVGEAGPQAALFDEEHRGGCHDLILVVHELREAVLGVADARLEQQVAAAHLLFDGQVLEHGHHTLADLAVEQVVEVLGRAGLHARIAVFERPAGRRDVLPRIEQPQQPIQAVERAPKLLIERPGNQRLLGGRVLVHQVVVQAQVAEVAIRLLDQQRLHALGRQRKLRMRLLQPQQRVDDLEAQEPVGLAQRVHQNRHRLLRRDLRQRRRDVAADPDVFVGIAQEVGERVDDAFAVAHQHLPRRRLQQPVAQQRHQRRDENVVVAAQPARALDRLERDLALRVVHQRHQQPAEARIRYRPQRLGDFLARRGRGRSRVAGQALERGFGRVHVVGAAGWRPRPQPP